LAAATGRQLALVAESDLNDPRLLTAHESGGFELDAQWSDDFHHALHSVLSGEKQGYYEDFGTLADLAKALRNAWVYDGRYSRFRRRRHGRPHNNLSGHRFLGYLQNHDQIGNRARGDRASDFLSVGRLQIGAALVLCSPFVPMLFQGEEWAATAPFPFFADHAEPDLARAVSEGRRREFAAFGWKADDVPDPQAPETFLGSKLNWNEITAARCAEMLAWHKRLIRLRRSEPSLSDGRLEAVEVVFDENERWLVLRRGTIDVVCNFRNSAQTVPLPPLQTREVLLASSAATLAESGLKLPAEAVAIVKSGPKSA
jgi:maltooligosyltrehalose trehalohydrolase